MAKKKIGTAPLKDGEAREWFPIEEELEKGVYQLIAEYSGSNIYRPSHDVKKLIIGWYAEIQADTHFRVDENKRTLTVKGRLLGYSDNNVPTPLKNRKVGVKIGSTNDENKNVYEQLVDGIPLYDIYTNSNITRTDADGYFTFNLQIPVQYHNKRYKLLLNYGGDYDYIACVHAANLYIGLADTFCSIHISPSYHVKNNGSFILTSMVLLSEDVDKNGLRKPGTTRIRNGSVTYWISNNGKDGWKQISASNDFNCFYHDTLFDDGLCEMRVYWGYDGLPEGASITKYLKAVYTGSPDGLGYAKSQSRVIQIKIDEDGLSASRIYANLQGYQSGTKTLFVKSGEANIVKKYKMIYDDTKNPVPDGTLRFRVDDDVKEDD